MNKQLRALAIYLPQFHPIPENDKWWGKGFTEWTNVTKAKPRFEGHYQPQLPTDLGFYDLRLSESRIEQAELAKANGISGFCYYHYWFNGFRVLNQPFDEVVKLGEPDFPFCLCWANENWSRTWDAAEHEVLIKQSHSLEDDEAHMKFLCSIFKDPRYIRVDEKPVFIVYKTNLFPDIKATAALWRRIAVEEGLPGIYLCAVEREKQKVDPTTFGFDAAIEFQPDSSCFPQREWGTVIEKIRHRIIKDPLPYGRDFVYEYEGLVNSSMARKRGNHKSFPCVTPGWDNSPRKEKNAVIFRNSNPDLYKKWLKHTVENFTPYSPEENFIFINAWNEWAEGNHLEPDRTWGNAYLQATKEVLSAAQPYQALKR
jgi:lipopolysaccharide biosynthesis protein